MQKRALAPSDRRQDILHPSEMAKSDWCPRASYFRIKTGIVPEKKFSFVLENIFDEGHATHRKWQNRFADMGIIYGYWIRHNERYGPGFRPDGDGWEYGELALSCPELMIHGHTDGYIPEDNCLIEVKTIGVGTLRFEAPQMMQRYDYDAEQVWKHLNRPLRSHINQGMLYIWLAQQMGYKVDKIVFIYEFKPNQQVKEFVAELNMDIVQPLLDKARSVVYALNGKSELPPCPFGGCQQCQEAEKNAESKTYDEKQPNAGNGLVKSGGAPESGPTGIAATAATGSRATTASGRSNRAERQRTDGILSETDGMGELAGKSSSTSTNRRKIRRRKAKED